MELEEWEWILVMICNDITYTNRRTGLLACPVCSVMEVLLFLIKQLALLPVPLH